MEYISTAYAYGNVVSFLNNVSNIAGWKIWYGDGSMVSSKDMSWEKAPDGNVQVVMLYERCSSTSTSKAVQKYRLGDKEYHYRRTLAGVDYYAYHSTLGYSEIFNDSSLAAKGSHLKYGKEIDISIYKKIHQKAYGDRDL